MTDVEVILSKFEYNPVTGVITRAKTGDVANRRGSQGYLRVCLNKKYGYRLAHRVAFVLMNGEWPDASMHVHHVNADRADDRWENLQLVTPRENNAAKVQREDSNIRSFGGRLQVSGGTTVDTMEQARAIRAGWQELVARVTGDGNQKD